MHFSQFSISSPIERCRRRTSVHGHWQSCRSPPGWRIWDDELPSNDPTTAKLSAVYSRCSAKLKVLNEWTQTSLLSQTYSFPESFRNSSVLDCWWRAWRTVWLKRAIQSPAGAPPGCLTVARHESNLSNLNWLLESHDELLWIQSRRHPEHSFASTNDKSIHVGL